MDVFDLYAKISLDSSEYTKGLEDAGRQADTFAGTLMANLVTQGIGLAIEGLKQLGEVAVETFQQSIETYAEYEQLLGGTSLVFGSAFDYITEKAASAYKTVQLSQNDYLEQVNGLAVGLKEAMGGNEQAAAELADKIVTAEADVVAALGITQEAAQNAFNGIMRGQFNMVDNLKLGLSATKEGIESMIEKVNDWNKAQGKSTQYTIDNVADVQAALVDYIEMQGLAGYASREATSTISGSIASVRAAWENLLSGLANDQADVDKLLDDLVDACDNAFEVLAPIAEKALEGMFELVVKALPKFAELGVKVGLEIIKGILLTPLYLVGNIMDAMGAFDQYKTDARASGGWMTAGNTYLVGEEGPELVTASKTSYVHNASDTADMLGGSGGIVININGDIYDDERSMKKKFRTAILDVLEEQVAYG